MCQLIYLGSSTDVDELPFDTEKPGFYYKRLSFDDSQYNSVLKLLDQPFLYFIGGSGGCSCTLSYTEPWENAPELNAEREVAISEVAKMLEFLSAQLKRSELRLLCTWWDVPVEEIKPMDWDQLIPGEQDFQFPLDYVLRLCATKP